MPAPQARHSARSIKPRESALGDGRKHGFKTVIQRSISQPCVGYVLSSSYNPPQVEINFLSKSLISSSVNIFSFFDVLESFCLLGIRPFFCLDENFSNFLKDPKMLRMTENDNRKSFRVNGKNFQKGRLTFRSKNTYVYIRIQFS